MVKIFKVGGAVRDQFLGVKSKDIDYAVEAQSYEEMKDFVKTWGKIFLEKPEFFTIRAKMFDEDADFVLCRKEHGYSDGRRPDQVTVGDIYDDLSRRDFTINAIALDMQENIIDPHNGVDDIRNKIIRCVGVAKDRFNEDSLRLLRAMRFSITKGFSLDDDIVDCLDDEAVVQKLKNVSKERIREEMNKCFRFNTWETMTFLFKFDLLAKQIFSEDIHLEATLKKVNK